MTHTHEKRSTRKFDLSGGALCLDFANTWENQGDPRGDRLLTYDDLLAFAQQSGLLDKGEVSDLAATAAKNPGQAEETLAFARELRRTVYQIFSARSACDAVPIAEIESINEVLGEALSHRRLVRRDEDCEWCWSVVDVTDLRSPTWAIIESAATLLTGDDLGRVRECAAENCNWLFLDRSRSGSRRWCSMKSCGNREKARRHYKRHRES